MKVFSSCVSLLPLAGFAVAFATSTAAQWSSNPALNLAIGDKPNEQNQSKVRATSDGGCYVVWLDNATGGYDTYLQRLNRQGVEQWAHNGVVIADTAFSSTQDYGMVVDASDRAVVAYRDDRFGGTQIGVNLVNADGSLAWGANGVLLTNTADFVASPKVAVTASGSYVVAWTQGNGYRVQRLNLAGVPQWAAGGLGENPATGSFSLSDLAGSDGDNAIVLLVRVPPAPPSNTRWLHTQKYDSAGARIWNAGTTVSIYDSASIQNGYFPSLVSDGNGGAVYGWYENGGPRNAYVQRVNASGAEVFPHGGVACSTNLAGRIRISASVAYCVASDEMFLYWSDSSSPVQNNWGVYGQKFNGATGARQWTDSGKELVALGPLQTSFVTAVADAAGNSEAFWFDQPGAGAHVMGARLNGAGAIQWGGVPIQVCSTGSGKARLWAAMSPCGTALVTWGDSRSDVNDIYGQNVKANGTYGNVARPGDIVVNGFVNVDDLLSVINAWGACPARCPADVAPLDCPNGYVNVDDLLAVINDWG